VCGDYTHQDTNLLSITEIDYCAVDAYHGSADPLHIVDLLSRTAAFNNPLGKPVLITEFGGSSRAQAVDHIALGLHAALWASTCVPVAGTPMLWWWMLIDEENLYSLFTPVAAFMEGEDRRDPRRKALTVSAKPPADSGERLGAVCYGGAGRALGWIFRHKAFQGHRDERYAPLVGAELRIAGLTNGTWTVEFWDTAAGRPAEVITCTATNGALAFVAPDLVRDVAFKAWSEANPGGR
jgi:hypothetical protein